eukprot:1195828-Prorocentrum_minimum.AAC.11
MAASLFLISSISLLCDAACRACAAGSTHAPGRVSATTAGETAGETAGDSWHGPASALSRSSAAKLFATAAATRAN